MSCRTLVVCFAVGTSVSCSQSLGPTSASSTSSSTTTTTVPSALAGHVVRSGSGAGVAAATVTLVDASGNSMTTITDAAGAFSFQNLAAGMYTLQTAAAGYFTSSAAITFPVSGFTVTLLPLGATPVSTLDVELMGPATLIVGHSSQLTATLVYTDGRRTDVTNAVKWLTSNGSVAAVSVTGLLTAYAVGTATLTANFQDVFGTLTVTTTAR